MTVPQQASPNHMAATEAEARIFWLGLIICPVVWTVFFFSTLFSLKLKWLVRCTLTPAAVTNQGLEGSDSAVTLTARWRLPHNGHGHHSKGIFWLLSLLHLYKHHDQSGFLEEIL